VLGAWVLILAAGGLAALWNKAPDLYQGTNAPSAAAATRAGILTAGAGLIAFAGVMINVAEIRRAADLTHEREWEGKITERYTRAVEQIGSGSLHVRLGGIYALERIARDSSDDQRTIVEVLSAYIRESSADRALRPLSESTTVGNSSAGFVRPATDIRAAVTVLARLPFLPRVPRADLTGANLTGPASLAGFRFPVAANLAGVDLRNVDLTHASLIKCNFAGADLGGAVLAGAALGGSDFTGADLGGANLADAELIGATLTRAGLIGSRLTDARMNKADLTGADLGGADLTDAVLVGANFNVAGLIGARLVRAELIVARLNHARMNEADLTGANLGGASLRRALLAGADLTGARLVGADFTGADLIGANFAGAQLVGADLTETRLSRAHLIGADLSGAHLIGAGLVGADLNGAVLAGADLTDARTLTQIQLDAALGDGATVLPSGIERPVGWIEKTPPNR
jgi:uncharacterized protein YjbI with pentapeptide repeats